MTYLRGDQYCRRPVSKLASEISSKWCRYCVTSLVLLCTFVILHCPDWAFAQGVESAEYQMRRLRMLEKYSDGIVLLHARPNAADLRDSGFKQDSSFFYFTGLASQPAAILALDGPLRKEILFVPPSASFLGSVVEGVGLQPGDRALAQKLGVDSIKDWDELSPYLAERSKDNVQHLYVDESRHVQAPGNPAGLAAVTGDRLLWRRSLEGAFPSFTVRSAKSTIQEMRWVKSEAEIRILRKVARVSADALLEGIRNVEAGKSQNILSSIIVHSCIKGGAVSPSFWPVVLSGSAAARGMLKLFFAYDRLDKSMAAGELVKLDVGCALDHYEGDVGRTVPVSGKFKAFQRETLDLLAAAYRAGLNAMHDGATFEEVRAASRNEVKRLEASLATNHARHVASVMTDKGQSKLWHIHGVGIDAAETGTSTLRAGAVIAYEPRFSAEGSTYYLEDMILITESGYEVLTTGLPYTASDVESIMIDR